jgi:hypothetical protein
MSIPFYRPEMLWRMSITISRKKKKRKKEREREQLMGKERGRILKIKYISYCEYY